MKILKVKAYLKNKINQFILINKLLNQYFKKSNFFETNMYLKELDFLLLRKLVIL